MKMRHVISTAICLALIPAFSFAVETSEKKDELNLSPESVKRIRALINKRQSGSTIDNSSDTGVNYFIKICSIKEDDIKDISKSNKNEWNKKVSDDLLAELDLQHTPTSEISKNWNSSLCKDVREQLKQVQLSQTSQQRIDALTRQNKQCIISDGDLDIILKINKSASEKEREDKMKKYGLINEKGQQTFSSPVEISNNWHSRKCESVRKEIAAERTKLTAATTIIDALGNFSQFSRKTSKYPGIESSSPHQSSAGILSATQDQYERLMPDNTPGDTKKENSSDGTEKGSK